MKAAVTYIKLLAAVVGLCAVAQYTWHCWWIGLLAALIYLLQGVYEAWQEVQRAKAARTWEPLSSQDARWQLRQDRWKPWP